MNPAASTLAAAAVPITPTPLRQDARIIGLVGLAHASSHFAHLLLPPLFPVFAVQFGLSFSELGFLMTVFFFISGVGQAMSGFLVDKVGARPVLFAALGCFLAACLAGAVAQGWGGLLVVAVFAGLGGGAAGEPSRSSPARWSTASPWASTRRRRSCGTRRRMASWCARWM